MSMREEKKLNYQEVRRASGGSCYADAMFRVNCEPDKYVEKMFERVLEKEYILNRHVELYFSQNGFVAFRDRQVWLQESYDFVEKHRKMAVHSLEEWIESHK